MRNEMKLLNGVSRTILICLSFKFQSGSKKANSSQKQIERNGRKLCKTGYFRKKSFRTTVLIPLFSENYCLGFRNWCLLCFYILELDATLKRLNAFSYPNEILS